MSTRLMLVKLDSIYVEKLGAEQERVRIFVSDITEQKRAEQELKLSDEKYRLIFESIASSIIVVDGKGEIVDVNPYHVHRIGKGRLSKKDYLGYNILDHASVVKAGLSHLYQQVLNGATLDRENVFFPRTSAGVEEYFNVRGGPLLKDGKVIGAVFVHDNVSERKKVEESLRQYAKIVSESKDMMALVNKEYIYTAVNSVYLKRFNLTSEQLLGHSVSEALGDEFFLFTVKANAERCLAGEEINYQKWFNFPAAGRLYLDVTYSPYIDSENIIQGFVVNGRNITEQKRMLDEIRSSEQHLRLYRDQTPLAAIEWNNDGQIVGWNIAAQNMFGYTLDEVYGRNIDFLLPEYSKEDAEQDWDCLREPDKNQALIKENYTKDGRILLCEWHHTLLRDEFNEIIGAASLLLDVTTENQAKQKLLYKEHE